MKRSKLPKPETAQEKAQRRHNHGDLRTTEHVAFPPDTPCLSLLLKVTSAIQPLGGDEENQYPGLTDAIEALPGVDFAEVMLTNQGKDGEVQTAKTIPVDPDDPDNEDKQLEIVVYNTWDWRMEKKGTAGPGRRGPLDGRQG